MTIPFADRTYQWTEHTNAADWGPLPSHQRDGFLMMSYHDKLTMMFGWDPQQWPVKKTANDVWETDAGWHEGLKWTNTIPNDYLVGTHNPLVTPKGRHTANWCLHDGKIWTIGGDDQEDGITPQFDVWTYDGSWALIDNAQPPWHPRTLSYCVSFGGWIWTIGGQQGSQSNQIPKREIWKTKTGLATDWIQVIPNEPFWPDAGGMGGAAVLNDRVYVVAGGSLTADNSSYQNAVWSSANMVDWTEELAEGHTQWTKRFFSDLTVWDDQMWMVAGLEGLIPQSHDFNDLYRSPDGQTWYSVPVPPEWSREFDGSSLGRHACGFCEHRDSLWVAGGHFVQGADVWQLKRGENRLSQRYN